MVHLISLASFSIFSSVLFSKFVIEEYKEDSLYLLFSYPLSRKKVFLSKIILCISLTLLFSIASQAFAYLVFMFTESIVPIMNNDVFTWNLLIAALPNIFIVGLQSVLVGLIAMQIGFIKRSLPTTIVSAVVISVIFCNILTIGSFAILNIITIVFYIILFNTITIQARYIDTLELGE
jgi:ABC-type transport system involved in multi-copper enzyme maturation permease subunit